MGCIDIYFIFIAMLILGCIDIDIDIWEGGMKKILEIFFIYIYIEKEKKKRDKFRKVKMEIEGKWE